MSRNELSPSFIENETFYRLLEDKFQCATADTLIITFTFKESKIKRKDK